MVNSGGGNKGKFVFRQDVADFFPRLCSELSFLQDFCEFSLKGSILRNKSPRAGVLDYCEREVLKRKQDLVIALSSGLGVISMYAQEKRGLGVFQKRDLCVGYSEILKDCRVGFSSRSAGAQICVSTPLSSYISNLGSLGSKIGEGYGYICQSESISEFGGIYIGEISPKDSLEKLVSSTLRANNLQKKSA